MVKTMARLRNDTMDQTLAEPTLGFEPGDDGRPALPRMGPAMAILTWIAVSAAMWGLLVVLADVL